MSTPPSERITISLDDVEQTYRKMHAIERALAKHDLTAFSALLLRTIATSPDAPLGSTAIKLGVAPAVISSAMDRLERRGLAERLARGGESSLDRRQVRARVTERGQALLASLETLELEL